MSHTSGPWKVKWTNSGRCDGIVPGYHNHEGDDCYDFARPGFQTCPHTEEIVTTDSGAYGPKPDDALLIAAAPELLEAARLALAVIDFCLPYITNESDRRVVAEQALRAAIAKAEGR